MINEILKDAEERMSKAVNSVEVSFNKIRTGRAHPSLLDPIKVNYYGSPTPLSQVANITVEDARTLGISPWEGNLVPEIEKAIMKSDLGLNPSTTGNLIRIPMPALTEETRGNYAKQARSEAENGRIAIRNIRRDANGNLKDLTKEKEISEDEERRGQDQVQKLTDKYVAKVEERLAAKEKDLMAI
ncbi:ribosome recycling factor [Marinomonas mediterranea]|jgi:ribosome recycling factor|uniref:Ribosome-recycling factor n=1 Tax=Marinomonas mediterranea (strain ATCC 700492 / JCM 21426 / NBRC 103028 / MMB-1) TaxID=717774 RepID=F2JU01_MARM1|nr:ribosome recycling factor [Marinomonas mediterranea]ADZ90422.1 Ribosome-recycling factor [Marinomonas mediterranea MMB-1]WCN16602.1 ribosome recycling factor [Marinomonas mediterranea MMB-1]